MRTLFNKLKESKMVSNVRVLPRREDREFVIPQWFNSVMKFIERLGYFALGAVLSYAITCFYFEREGIANGYAVYGNPTGAFGIKREVLWIRDPFKLREVQQVKIKAINIEATQEPTKPPVGIFIDGTTEQATKPSTTKGVKRNENRTTP